MLEEGGKVMSVSAQMAADIFAVRPFVPAKDFQTSLRFYADLGFRTNVLEDGIAAVHLGPFGFLLQSSNVGSFAGNLMMQMLVKDVTTWWTHIAELNLDGRYGVQAPRAP